jgi:hypothetical protein
VSEQAYGAGETLAERLLYASHERCSCGYGFAYDRGGKVFTESGSPFAMRPDQWECAGILLYKAGELPTAERERLAKTTHERPISFASGFDVRPERKGEAATTRAPVIPGNDA